jgi:hypothetical protein
MRQSFKQKIMVSPENQLQQASFREALGQSSKLGEVEMGSEFGSMQEKLKNTAKKNYR